MYGVILKLKGGENIHSANDLNVILTSKTFTKPEPQIYTVEVPGRNGLLDLTEGLMGRVAYNNGTITLTFVAPGKVNDTITIIDYFNKLHGQEVELIDDDFSSYKYKGRCSISIENQFNYQSITATIDAYPFMQSLETKVSTTVISSTSKTISIENKGLHVIPKIEVSANAKIVFNDTTMELSNGTYVLSEFELVPGTNVFKVSGSGTFKVSFNEEMHYYV